MPVLDRIRDRVRRADCLFAAFPDDGGKVLSPMNSRLFPRPGTASVGVKDIDEGLLVPNYCSPASGGYFRFISGNYGARFYIPLNISGETPHHTMIFRAYITDTTTETEYPYCYRALFCMSGGTSYLDHANLTCQIDIDGQRKLYGIGSYACFQSDEEFNAQSSSAVRSAGKVEKRYTRSGMTHRWLTVAATVDNATKTHCLYLNGVLAARSQRNTWTADRNRFSYASGSRVFHFGHSYALKEFSAIHTMVSHAALFNTVMTPLEIKYLSEE